MIIFAGGIWNRENRAGQELVKALTDNVGLAIRSDSRLIETDFSRIVVGRRSGFSEYNNLIGLNYSSNKPTGFLAGRLFKTHPKEDVSGLVESLDSYVIQRIIETKGDFLGKNYWGQYLLLLQDTQSKKVLIFPDPLGYSSVFYAKIDQGIIFSSDVWCLKDVLGNKAALDDDFLRSQINCNLGGLLSSSHTPFIGIFEVLHGYCLTATESSFEISQFWDQFALAQDGEFSQNDVIHTFLNVISSWSLKSPNICVSLSGGLDSSSLLMGAQYVNKNDKKLSALTFRNSSVASSDETESAARAANFCNIKLQIHPWEKPWCLDKNSNKYERLDKPHILSFSKNAWIEQEDLILQHGDAVLWSGHGGDQLFCEGINKESLADYLIDNGFKGLFDNLIDSCMVNRVSIPYMLKNTITSLIRYYFRCTQNIKEVRFENPSWFLQKDTDKMYLNKVFLPPFIEKSKHFPPAKFDHIASIYEGPNQSKVVEKLYRIPIVYPYYSQPLVELALTMPIYKSYSRSYSRAPFREEISKFFGTDIVFRRSKGETSGVLQLGVQQNINRIYELCLEGYFAKQNMLNKRILENHIRKVQFGKIEELHFIINLLSVELWLDNWGY